MAPDVCAVTTEVRKGDMVAAWHEMTASKIADVKESELPKDGKEPALPAAEIAVDSGVAKARFATELLVRRSDKAHLAMRHAARAAAARARQAWTEALREFAIKQSIVEGTAVVDAGGVIWVNSESARQSQVKIDDKGDVLHDGKCISKSGEQIIINGEGVFVDGYCVKEFAPLELVTEPVINAELTALKNAIKVLEKAAARVEAAEHLAHAVIIREYIGRVK